LRDFTISAAHCNEAVVRRRGQRVQRPAKVHRGAHAGRRALLHGCKVVARASLCFGCTFSQSGRNRVVIGGKETKPFSRTCKVQLQLPFSWRSLSAASTKLVPPSRILTPCSMKLWRGVLVAALAVPAADGERSEARFKSRYGHRRWEKGERSLPASPQAAERTNEISRRGRTATRCDARSADATSPLGGSHAHQLSSTSHTSSSRHGDLPQLVRQHQQPRVLRRVGPPGASTIGMLQPSSMP
jgi:hypothetical protein